MKQTPSTVTPTAEQLVLLRGMCAVLKEELGATEQRLTGRVTEVESKFDNLKDDFHGLERRLGEVGRGGWTKIKTSLAANCSMSA